MTGRERALVASTQDRMLRDADSIFYREPVRTCGTCDAISGCSYRDVTGAELDGRVGRCGQLDLVCELEAPACEWWS